VAARAVPRAFVGRGEPYVLGGILVRILPGEERGSGGVARLLGPVVAARPPQPISSRVLPLVSLTYRSTNGMESAAKTV
jgi:hypothetical protein